MLFEQYLLVAFAGACVGGAVGWAIGDRKRRPLAGFVLGFLLGPVGWLLTLLGPDGDADPARLSASNKPIGRHVLWGGAAAILGVLVLWLLFRLTNPVTDRSAPATAATSNPAEDIEVTPKDQVALLATTEAECFRISNDLSGWWSNGIGDVSFRVTMYFEVNKADVAGARAGWSYAEGQLLNSSGRPEWIGDLYAPVKQLCTLAFDPMGLSLIEFSAATSRSHTDFLSAMARAELEVGAVRLDTYSPLSAEFKRLAAEARQAAINEQERESATTATARDQPPSGSGGRGMTMDEVRALAASESHLAPRTYEPVPSPESVQPAQRNEPQGGAVRSTRVPASSPPIAPPIQFDRAAWYRSFDPAWASVESALNPIRESLRQSYAADPGACQTLATAAAGLAPHLRSQACPGSVRLYAATLQDFASYCAGGRPVAAIGMWTQLTNQRNAVLRDLQKISP